MSLSRVTTACLFAIVSLCACTSWRLAAPATQTIGPYDASHPKLARICVVRTSLLAQAVTFPTRDNDVLVGATRGRTFFCYLAEPGEHAIAIEADDVEHATLVAEAGRTYVLHQGVDNVFGWVRCRAAWVTPSQAGELFDQAEHEILVSVPGSERLPGHPPYAAAKKPPAT